jgi:hypothetical protein
MASPNPTHASGQATAAAPSRQAENLHADRRNAFNNAPLAARPIGYGLPCANCKTYYASNLTACPVCKSPQRVAAVAPPVATVAPAEKLPDPAQLEEERERFLREFNAQVIASPLPADAPTPALHCNRQENHANSAAPATICQECFDHMQERVDVLQAALHMDVKEASQIIYDAVWADPSDPNKTYLNAAQALLSELKRRSGVANVFGPLQPPPN